MTPLYLLDTDTASFIVKRRTPGILERLAAVPPDRIAVSAVTRAEMMYGLKALPPEHRLQLGVRQFLKLVRVLAWDGESADYYAEIRHQLASTGRAIGEMDMMIAAHALGAGAVLVTNNTRHFERIALPLLLENWTDSLAGK